MLRRAVFIGSVFVSLVAGIPSSALAQPREGFWFGIGGGYGSASVSCDEACSEEKREGSGVGYLRGGWTLSQRALVGLDANLWSKSAQDGDIEMTFNFYSITGSMTFYPAAASGFFLKAGAGISAIDVDLDFEGSSLTADLGTGLGLTFGAGYDVRLGRMISLTPAFEYLYGRPGDPKFGPDTLFSNWRQHITEFTLGITFH